MESPNDEGRARSSPDAEQVVTSHSTHHTITRSQATGDALNGNGIRRRYAASRRLPPLAPCGCVRDPDHDRHRCRSLVSDRMVDAGAQAAHHLLAHGCIPILGTDTLRGLWRRGDRVLAQQLYDLAGG